MALKVCDMILVNGLCSRHVSVVSLSLFLPNMYNDIYNIYIYGSHS